MNGIRTIERVRFSPDIPAASPPSVADAIDKAALDSLAVLGLTYAEWRESGYDERKGDDVEEAYRTYAEHRARLDGEPPPVWGIPIIGTVTVFEEF